MNSDPNALKSSPLKDTVLICINPPSPLSPLRSAQAQVQPEIGGSKAVGTGAPNAHTDNLITHLYTGFSSSLTLPHPCFPSSPSKLNT